MTDYTTGLTERVRMTLRKAGIHPLFPDGTRATSLDLIFKIKLSPDAKVAYVVIPHGLLPPGTGYSHLQRKRELLERTLGKEVALYKLPEIIVIAFLAASVEAGDLIGPEIAVTTEPLSEI
jgi:hypothetical protein